MVKQAAVGIEVWRNTTKGRIWYFTVDARGVQRSRSIEGGRDLRVTEEQREMLIDACSNRASSPFLNGALKRIDSNIADPELEPEEQEGKTPLPEGYDPEKALETSELAAIYQKNGQAFQSAVKKLTERSVRLMRELATNPDSGVEATLPQVEFLDRWVKENFAGGKSSAQSLEALTPS